MLPVVLNSGLISHDEVKQCSPPEVHKRIVLCITKDINEDDLSLLKEYGKVLVYDHELLNNLNPEHINWDYLVVDLREKNDRYFYMKCIVPQKHQYQVIVYSYGFETDELVPNCDNQINSFPKKQARKQDFDALLLQERLKKPRWYVSLFKCVVNAYQKVKA
jgi:hypothetical protein